MTWDLAYTLLKIGIICFLINIPFGIIRSRTRNYSMMWFLCIHAPIPVSAVMRREAGLGWEYIIILLIFSIAGQIAGKKTGLAFFPQKKIK